jgi:hypothetical protein
MKNPNGAVRKQYATASKEKLHQNDIVLLLAVSRFDLQRNRLGDEVGKLR